MFDPDVSFEEDQDPIESLDSSIEEQGKPEDMTLQDISTIKKQQENIEEEIDELNPFISFLQLQMQAKIITFTPIKQQVQQQDSVEQPQIPKDYQLDLYKNSCTGNSIIFLPTGMGKTLIALMHIYRHLTLYGEGFVKIVFLANTIQLVEQQARYIRKNFHAIANFMEANNLHLGTNHSDPSRYKNADFMKNFVIPIHARAGSQSEDYISSWDLERWELIKQNSTIFVMMGQMLLNALRRGYLKLPHFSLIVIDECHHAKLNHPYRLIIKEFLDDETVRSRIQHSEKVQIIGLTASPVVNINIDQQAQNMRIDSRKIELEALQLAINLRSKYVMLNPQGLQKKKREIEIKPFEPRYSTTQYHVHGQNEITKFYGEIAILAKNFFDGGGSFETNIFLRYLLHLSIEQGIMILKELGEYPFFCFILKISQDVRQLCPNLKQESDRQLFQSLNLLFQKYVEIFKAKFLETEIEQNLSDKFRALLSLLRSVKKPQNQNQLKHIIFVDQKLIAKYMSETLRKLELMGESFKVDFVVGTGNNTDSSLQQAILDEKNTKILLQNIETNQIQKIAEETYRQFDVAQRAENELAQSQGEGSDDQELLTRQRMLASLEELQFGIKKLGKKLDQTVYDSRLQQEKIRKFKNHEFDILVSTNVTEEGFDIPECNIVIIYGVVRTLQQYIQKIGRARQEDSKIFAFVEEPKVMEWQVKIQVLEQTIASVNETILQFNELKEYEYEKRRDVLERENCKQRQSSQKEFYNKVFVKESLALLNTNWAVEVLSNFASFYFRRQRKSPDNYVKGVFYQYVEVPAIGWRCVIILPKNIKDRFFVGNIQATKVDAKKDAAFKAVCQLRKLNCLTDDLRPIKLGRLFVPDEKEDSNMFDPQYKEVIDQTVIIKKEEKLDLSQKYYPFELNVLNLNSQKPVYLYRFIFFCNSEQQLLFNLDTFPNYPGESKNNPISIGLLHNAKLETHRFKKGSEMQMNYEGEILLNFSQYQQLLLIHQFLVATSFDWDIEFYSKITGEDVTHESYLFQNKKQMAFKKLESGMLVSLFVLLRKNIETSVYQICEESNKNVMEYIARLKKVFLFLNSLKQKKKQNKITREERERLKDASLKLQSWQRQEPDQEVLEKAEKDQGAKYMVVQAISETLFLGKMVVLQECLLTEPLAEIEERKQNLRKVINHPFDNDKVLGARVLRKFLKIPRKQFKNQIFQNQQDDVKCKYIAPEFYKFPLNIGTCFKLRLLLKDFMYMVRDHFLIFTFRDDILWSRKLGQVQPYQYQIMDNLIVQEEVGLMEFKEESTGFQRIRLDQQLKRLSSLKIEAIRPEQRNKVQEQQQKAQRYSIAEIPQDTLVKCFKSQIYEQDEQLNYQVLELLGDAVLKLLASIQVFVEQPFANENALHVSRAQLVSNDNLRRVAIINHLFRYTLCFPFQFFPQGFTPEETERPLNSTKKQDQQEENSQPRYTAYRNKEKLETLPLNYQYVPDKVHSDVVEAINGAFFLHYRNIEACQWFLHSIGVLKTPSIQLTLKQSQTRKAFYAVGEMIGKLEQLLSYKFRDQSIIIQALTHPESIQVLEHYCYLKQKSQSGFVSTLDQLQRNWDFRKLQSNEVNEKLIETLNKIHNQVRLDMSYDRLEYLGDAVLDSVVVEWLVQEFSNEQAGDLSLKKQCIVCNKALALATLKYSFDAFLIHPKFHNPQDDKHNHIDTLRKNYNVYYEDISQMYCLEPDIIKILGDLFESIIGAIFVDSEFNYAQTKQVIYDLLMPFMTHFSSKDQIQKHPQSRLRNFLNEQHYGNMDFRITNSEAIDGENEYALISLDNQKCIVTVRARGEKEAKEKILERIQKRGKL